MVSGLFRFEKGVKLEGHHFTDQGELKRGDVLLFAAGKDKSITIDVATGGRGVSHAAIYIGDGKFVHAANPSDGVKTSSLADLKTSAPDRTIVVVRAKDIDQQRLDRVAKFAEQQQNKRYEYGSGLLSDPGKNEA